MILIFLYRFLYIFIFLSFTFISDTLGVNICFYLRYIRLSLGITFEVFYLNTIIHSSSVAVVLTSCVNLSSCFSFVSVNSSVFYYIYADTFMMVLIFENDSSTLYNSVIGFCVIFSSNLL